MVRKIFQKKFCPTSKILCILEREYINLYRSIGKAEYNIADGGEGGDLGENWYKSLWKSCHTEEYRNKLSNALIGHHTSEERKKKISESLKRNYASGHIKKNYWTRGKHWFNNGVENVMANECPKGFVTGRLINYTISDETRLKQSKARKGKKFTDEHKHKISESNKGKIITLEQRKQISETLKSKHLHWYTNDKINVLAKKCPNGFHLGCIKNFKKRVI